MLLRNKLTYAISTNEPTYDTTSCSEEGLALRKTEWAEALG